MDTGCTPLVDEVHNMHRFELLDGSNIVPAWQKLGWDPANCHGALLDLPTKPGSMDIDVAELRTKFNSLFNENANSLRVTILGYDDIIVVPAEVNGVNETFPEDRFLRCFR